VVDDLDSLDAGDAEHFVAGISSNFDANITVKANAKH